MNQQLSQQASMIYFQLFYLHKIDLYWNGHMLQLND